MITANTINSNLPLPIPNMGDQTKVGPTERWEWGNIIWKKVEKMVFNLQKRIYKATKAGLLSKAKALTKLLMRSS